MATAVASIGVLGVVAAPLATAHPTADQHRIITHQPVKHGPCKGLGLDIAVGHLNYCVKV